MQDKTLVPVVLMLIVVAGMLIFEKINRKPKVELWTEPPLTETTPPPPESKNYTYENEELGISYVFPDGFVPVECEREDELTCMNHSDKSNRLSKRPEIVMRKIEMNNQDDYQTIMIDDVTFDPSGLKPEDFSEFTSIMVESTPVYKIKTGLFEGILATNYYVVRNNYILVFEVTSSPVDWTAPGYDPEQDELNREVLMMMEGIEITN